MDGAKSTMKNTTDTQKIFLFYLAIFLYYAIVTEKLCSNSFTYCVCVRVLVYIDILFGKRILRGIMEVNAESLLE